MTPASSENSVSKNSVSDGAVSEDAAESAEALTETIMLSVPATGPYGRIARMSGAALALRRGLSLAAVEDLRLAIDEALILLLGNRNHEGSVDLAFELEPDAISIEFFPNFEDGAPELSGESVERFAELAGPLLTAFTIDSNFGTVKIHKSS